MLEANYIPLTLILIREQQLCCNEQELLTFIRFITSFALVIGVYFPPFQVLQILVLITKFMCHRFCQNTLHCSAFRRNGKLLSKSIKAAIHIHNVHTMVGKFSCTAVTDFDCFTEHFECRGFLILCCIHNHASQQSSLYSLKSKNQQSHSPKLFLDRN